MASFCFWSKEHKLNETDLDPNYLFSGNMRDSPFHQMLHLFAMKNKEMPLFHVDIHGKMDRKDCYDLDLGIDCLIKHWEGLGEQEFLIAFVETLTSGFNKIFANIPKYKNFQAVCNKDCYLNGDWGCEIKTMNEQAVILGIPSI